MYDSGEITDKMSSFFTTPSIAWNYADNTIYQLNTSGNIVKSNWTFSAGDGYMRSVITPDTYSSLPPMKVLSQINDNNLAASN